ncbi:hypothetical protein OHB26_16425 [Nocardia sp. NBC_01503]|uniref:hypothetical protein n=1 Tax=Nocardia sp. NBC_01503 TaxID=2975997 RepID=UPI002E7B2CE9|nr:hypothetical protein [Nocardia sp. NBC_01503]WTL35637.1 hypothetical protein OHB26_16425 [Nocardia sp. NBC_01503]
MTSSTDQVMKLIITRLSESLAAERFLPCDPPGDKLESQPGKRYPRWRNAWFAGGAGADPQMTPTIQAHLLRSRSGSVGLSGWAWILSDAVARVRAELPNEALENAAESLVPSSLESVPFGHFHHPQNVGLATIWITLESDVDYCVGRFMDSVLGPVRQWFSQRATLTDLLALAPTPAPGSLDQSNPDSVRLRDVVIVALLRGRTEEAVSLMRWYRGRDQFDAWDSPDRVAAFDAALIDRFPDYAGARLVD